MPLLALTFIYCKENGLRIRNYFILSPNERNQQVELFGEVATLKQIVAEQREEIALLKGLKGRPNVKPSGMDKGTAPAKPAKDEKRHGRGKVVHRVGVEEKVIKAKIPFQGIRILSGAGPRDFGARDLLPARTLGHARWPDDPGPIARGDRRSFRPGTAPLRADAISSGAVNDAPAAGLVTLDGGRDLEAAVGSPVERKPRGLHR